MSSSTDTPSSRSKANKVKQAQTEAEKASASLEWKINLKLGNLLDKAESADSVKKQILIKRTSKEIFELFNPKVEAQK